MTLRKNCITYKHFSQTRKNWCNQAKLTKHINYSPPTETLRSYCGSNICHMTRIGEVATRSLRAHGFYQRLSYKANSSGIQCSFQQAYTGESNVGSTAEHTHASPSTLPTMPHVPSTVYFLCRLATQNSFCISCSFTPCHPVPLHLSPDH